MHRIDEDANVNNLFAEADPGTGALGTRVGAPWMNDVQENLCQFIEGMGLTLSKGDYTQLLDAILALQGRENTWTAAQTVAALLTLSGADVNLTKAAAQAVLKSGGKLQFGTSDANDVELLRAGVVALVLGATQIDCKSRTLINAAIAAPTFTVVSLNANWAHGGTGTMQAAYAKDGAGAVHVRGTVKATTSGLSTVAFTLPAGYRPAYAAGGPCYIEDSGTVGSGQFIIQGSTGAALPVLASGAPANRVYNLNINYLADG